MEFQLGYFPKRLNTTYPSEPNDAFSFLQQLQLRPRELRREDDTDSTGLAPSETLTFAQTSSNCGESFLDVCTPPLSPYSQVSNPLSFSNRWNEGEYEISPKTAFEDSQSVPVCFDFVQGRCARSNCRYAHNPQSLQQPQQQPIKKAEKRGICFDFLRGDCHRGALCRFTHDLSDFAMEDTISAEEDVSLAKVKRWGQGICFDFVRGGCKRGETCPWSHNLLEIAVATKKGIEHMETSERNKIADTVRSRLHASRKNSNSAPEEETPKTETPSMKTPTNLTQSQAEQSLFVIEAPRERSTQWVSLWNYPETVFGPMDEFGRPLHWLTNASGNLMF